MYLWNLIALLPQLIIQIFCLLVDVPYLATWKWCHILYPMLISPVLLLIINFALVRCGKMKWGKSYIYMFITCIISFMFLIVLAMWPGFHWMVAFYDMRSLILAIVISLLIISLVWGVYGLVLKCKDSKARKWLSKKVILFTCIFLILVMLLIHLDNRLNYVYIHIPNCNESGEYAHIFGTKEYSKINGIEYKKRYSNKYKYYDIWDSGETSYKIKTSKYQELLADMKNEIDRRYRIIESESQNTITRIERDDNFETITIWITGENYYERNIEANHPVVLLASIYRCSLLFEDEVHIIVKDSFADEVIFDKWIVGLGYTGPFIAGRDTIFDIVCGRLLRTKDLLYDLFHGIKRE